MTKNYFTDSKVEELALQICEVTNKQTHDGSPIYEFTENRLKALMNLAVEEAIGDVVAEVKFMSVDGDSRIGGVLWYGNKYNTPINTPLYSLKELEN